MSCRTFFCSWNCRMEMSPCQEGWDKPPGSAATLPHLNQTLTHVAQQESALSVSMLQNPALLEYWRHWVCTEVLSKAGSLHWRRGNWKASLQFSSRLRLWEPTFWEMDHLVIIGITASIPFDRISPMYLVIVLQRGPLNCSYSISTHTMRCVCTTDWCLTASLA